MNRSRLALLVSISAASLAAAGCRDTTTNFTTYDLAHAGTVYDLSGVAPGSDLSGLGADLAMAGTPMSIHDLYSQGQKGAAYTIQNVVVTGIGNYAGKSKKTMKCEYEAFVQDMNSPPPSGIKLFVTGAMCTNSTSDAGMTSCTCFYPPMSGTVLDQIGNPSSLGQIYTITGTWDPYMPAAGESTEHELDIATMTMTGTGGTITPIVVTDPTQFAGTAADAGAVMDAAGYTMYENTLVTVKPASAQPVTLGMYGFTWAGANFGSDYRYFYDNKGTFPAANQTFSAITGIPVTAYGGSVVPRTAADFVQ